MTSLETFVSRFQHLQGAAISVERSDVDVDLAGVHRRDAPAAREKRIDHPTQVLVAPVARGPKSVKLGQRGARNLEASPDPARSRPLGLDLDLAYVAPL